MEFKSRSRQSRQANDPLLRPNRHGPSLQRSAVPGFSSRPAPLLSNPHVTPRQLHLQRRERQLTDFTVSPVAAQRQALAPMLEGLQLQREVLDTVGPGSHRQTLQRQIEDHRASLGSAGLQIGQYEAAVQRQADLQTPVAPLTQRPSSPAQWSQGGQWEVQRVADPSKAGHTISLREQEQAQHLGVLRTVGVQLGQGFRSDTGPAVQRYAEYGAALAPFQRMGTGTGRAVVTTALMQVPVSQRQTLQRAIDDTIQRQQAQETHDRAVIQLHSLQRQLEHLDSQPEQPLMERIQARRGAGNPIPTALRKALELELNHDLSRVRLHDDAEADTLAKKVNAVAFTTGQDIFFKAGTFNPNTRSGVELIAHEVKHTKQQAQGTAKPGIDGDAGQEHDARSFGSQFAGKVNLDALAGLEHKAVAQNKQAQTLPAPPQLAANPHAPGVYTRQAALARVKDGAAQSALHHGFAGLGLQRLHDGTVQRNVFGDVWNATGGKVVSAVADKGKEIVSSGLKLIPGYKELCMTFGKDLVTGKAMAQNPNAILDALSNWLPGPLKDIIKAVKESGAMGKAWAWFQGELKKLNLGGLLGEVGNAIKSASLSKARDAVMSRVGGLKALIVGSARRIADIALTALAAGLGPVGQQVVAQLRKSGDLILQVMKNPAKFAGNLINALKGGFRNFSSNASKHLQNGLGQWLSGASGMVFPAKLDAQGVLMTALSVMGLTYQAMRGRLIAQLGPGGAKKVQQAEGMGGALQTIKGGLHKADEMKSSGGSIGGEVVAGIKGEVTQGLVVAGITKVASLLIPGGGFITALIGAFKSVQFLIQQGSQIMGVITSALGSVSAIAAGNIGAAAGLVETTLARSIPVALGFLSKVLGIGNMGGKIRAIIEKVRGKLDRVLDKVIARVKTVIEKITGKGKPGETAVTPTASADKTKDHDLKVEKGLADIPRIEQSLAKNGVLQNHAAALNVARILKGRHTIFKSVTPQFSKQKVTYDWVASRGTAGGTAPLAVLNINVEGIRKEFWKKAGRPGWSAATKAAMAKQYPGQHMTVAGITLRKLKHGNDRRHIMAFDQTVTNVASQLNNLPYDDAKNLLTAKGFPPKTATESAIKAALKLYLAKEFNEVQNLFVGDAPINQQKGRDMELAEQRRIKALKAGNQPVADLETRTLAGHATDVPKGKASGQKLGVPQQASLSILRAFDAADYAALRGHMKDVKAGKGTPELRNLWTLAQVAMNDSRRATTDLAQFSKTGNPAANTKITNAIEHSTVQLRIMSDIVGGS